MPPLMEVDLLINSRNGATCTVVSLRVQERRCGLLLQPATCVITGRVNHAANENNVVKALVCFSRTAPKRSRRNATRGVSKPRTVTMAVIRFPRGSHNRIKLNTPGSHDHIGKHTLSMNAWNVCEKRRRRVRGASAHAQIKIYGSF